MKTLACLIVTAMVDSSAVCSLTIDSLLVFACNQLRFDSGFFYIKRRGQHANKFAGQLSQRGARFWRRPIRI